MESNNPFDAVAGSIKSDEEEEGNSVVELLAKSDFDDGNAVGVTKAIGWVANCSGALLLYITPVV